METSSCGYNQTVLEVPIRSVARPQGTSSADSDIVFLTGSNVLSSSTNNKPCVTALPPEIRNLIFSHTFVDEGDKSQLRILLTCRQFYLDARLMAFSRTKFHLPVQTLQPHIFSRLVNKLPIGTADVLRHLACKVDIWLTDDLAHIWNGRPFDHPDLYLDTLEFILAEPYWHDRGTSSAPPRLIQKGMTSLVRSFLRKGLYRVSKLKIANHNDSDVFAENCISPIVVSMSSNDIKRFKLPRTEDNRVAHVAVDLGPNFQATEQDWRFLSYYLEP
ncbi:hypothetical protein K470DRAFT_264460 [Piedraia hortae CBS 480.64]|uniref:F-box domain-containing protein n=1 Tax=Piedraia hortae CBS 480.64 TaxID=1314780 RepID=A0A6A7C0K9_9PEZI|nr:hypothetical protein K470DRAFT_264460 [Piedraia hortae CBS 480.64]